MEQKSSLDQTSLESFFFQISYVPPGEYGGRHLLEACPRHVSVHALLAECDRPMPAVMCLTGSFNPRTPCGVRPSWERVSGPERGFQSTHSLRSATHHPLRHMLSIKRFNPRTPCGVRLLPSVFSMSGSGFQSTHSLRSATFVRLRTPRSVRRFNPRTPCGVRQAELARVLREQEFQSTHSLRSATFMRVASLKWDDVSIHALLAECD